MNISVKENVANGTCIYQVKAIDKDSGNNSRIKYTLLSGEYEENFVIDASSGNVSVDRESRGDFTLQATDGKFRSNMSLLITILDVNEFQPVFNPQYYKRNISEMASFGTPIIRVSATDEDSAENSIIHYKVISGNINGTFGISETNGTILLQKSLDYETLRSPTVNIIQPRTFQFKSKISMTTVRTSRKTFIQLTFQMIFL